jgi:hypothetical protein
LSYIVWILFSWFPDFLILISSIFRITDLCAYMSFTIFDVLSAGLNAGDGDPSFFIQGSIFWRSTWISCHFPYLKALLMLLTIWVCSKYQIYSWGGLKVVKLFL